MSNRGTWGQVRHVRPDLITREYHNKDKDFRDDIITHELTGENGFLNQFGEVRVTERTPIIEVKSSYGFTRLRDNKVTVGSGDVTNSPGDGEYRVFTTANGTDSAKLSTNEYGRYIPGFDAEGGVGVRIPTLPTGSQDMKWGLFTDENGFFFGHDSTGFYVGVRREGEADNIIRPASWNGDPLDGTGESGLTIDFSRGNIFQVTFTWYGYGTINFDVILPDASGTQKKVTVHSFSPSGKVSTKDPNLPCTVEVSNNGESTSGEIFVGGRSYQIVGPFKAKRRIVSDYRISQGSINTTFVPLISFRNKSEYKSVSVEVEGFDLISDADLIVQLRADATLTGASFGTPSGHQSSETASESDIVATAVSGGIPLTTGLLESSGTGGNSSGAISIAQVDFNFPDAVPVTLCARRVSGSGATVTSVFRINEEW